MRKTVFISIGSKGGIGKSFTANATVSALRREGIKIRVLETDTSNSSMQQVRFSNDESTIDMNDVTSRGAFELISQNYADGGEDNFYIDFGARDESKLHEFLNELHADLVNVGANLIPLRPLTLCSFTQSSAIDFAEMFPHIGQIILLNLGQGRTLKHFELWLKSQARANILSGLTVEGQMEDASPYIADNAAGLGLSLGDIADRNFAVLDEKKRARANSVFDPIRVKFIERYLERHIIMIRRKIHELEVKLKGAA